MWHVSVLLFSLHISCVSHSCQGTITFPYQQKICVWESLSGCPTDPAQPLPIFNFDASHKGSVVSGISRLPLCETDIYAPLDTPFFPPIMNKACKMWSDKVIGAPNQQPQFIPQQAHIFQ